MFTYCFWTVLDTLIEGFLFHLNDLQLVTKPNIWQETRSKFIVLDSADSFVLSADFQCVDLQKHEIKTCDKPAFILEVINL